MLRHKAVYCWGRIECSLYDLKRKGRIICKSCGKEIGIEDVVEMNTLSDFVKLGTFRRKDNEIKRGD